MDNDVTGRLSKQAHRFAQSFFTILMFIGYFSASTPVAALEVPASGGYYFTVSGVLNGPFNTEIEAKNGILPNLQTNPFTFCAESAGIPTFMLCVDDPTLTGDGPWTWDDYNRTPEVTWFWTRVVNYTRRFRHFSVQNSNGVRD